MSTARETEDGASATIFFRSAATHSYSAVVQAVSHVDPGQYDMGGGAGRTLRADGPDEHDAFCTGVGRGDIPGDRKSDFPRTTGRHGTRRCSPEQLMHAPEGVRDARAT